jgi:signal peptidase
MTTGDGPLSPREWADWFLHTDHGVVVYVRELLTSALAVIAVGLLLFAISGLWPPMVAVESSSMNPHLQIGDLVFVMEEHRFAGDSAYDETGVVTYRAGQQSGYTKFHKSGDVIVYRPAGSERETPIIHRAMFWVNDSENWYDKARAVDPAAVGGAESCAQLDNCPAPYGGFITKGDNPMTNRRYDQVSGLAPPVKAEWVVGTAEFRIPFLGNIRLWVSRGASLSIGAPTPIEAVGLADAETGTNATSLSPAEPTPRSVSPVEPVGSATLEHPTPATVAARYPRANATG